MRRFQFFALLHNILRTLDHYEQQQQNTTYSHCPTRYGELTSASNPIPSPNYINLTMPHQPQTCTLPTLQALHALRALTTDAPTTHTPTAPAPPLPPSLVLVRPTLVEKPPKLPPPHHHRHHLQYHQDHHYDHHHIQNVQRYGNAATAYTSPPTLQIESVPCAGIDGAMLVGLGRGTGRGRRGRGGRDSSRGKARP